MTGNGRELGGSFALGPRHVRRAGHGTMPPEIPSANSVRPVTGPSGT